MQRGKNKMGVSWCGRSGVKNQDYEFVHGLMCLEFKHVRVLCAFNGKAVKLRRGLWSRALNRGFGDGLAITYRILTEYNVLTCCCWQEAGLLSHIFEAKLFIAGRNRAPCLWMPAVCIKASAAPLTLIGDGSAGSLQRRCFTALLDPGSCLVN